jgi:type 1 fimbria pilin
VACDTNGEIYQVNATAGSTYMWTVPDGAEITAGQGTSQITVDFNGNFGEISVAETGAQGCEGPSSILLVQCAIDVSELAQNQVIIYPNPVRDILNIEAPTATSATTMELTDASGRVLLRERIGVRTTLSLDAFAQGVYFVVIRHDTHQQTFRIIKH